jgi:predicted O-methyltransferase YrrM
MDNSLIEKYLPSVIKQTMHGAGDSDRHMLPLFSMALASKGKLFLELGVRDGVTTLPLLLAAHANGGKLISVDINPTTFVCPPELQASWQFIQQDALTFLKSRTPGEVYDLAFIDDWHTYPHVKKELKFLEPHLTPSSVVYLHDLMYGGTEPRYHSNPAMHKGEWAWGGPYRAVAELHPRTWEWATLPWNSGLTILRKNAGVFEESRLKIWSKRILKAIAPAWERKAVAKHQELKNK